MGDRGLPRRAAVRNGNTITQQGASSSDVARRPVSAAAGQNMQTVVDKKEQES